MRIKSLKIFCDIVNRRSFSRAADENDISQSKASQIVHQLEQRFDTQLIDRSKRPFVLTAEGKTFYEGCRPLVQSYFELEEEVRSLHQEVSGRVVVASIYSVGLYHMSRYLQEFLAAHPKANLKLEYLHPNHVYDAVENDRADLGLLSYPRSSRGLEIIPWRREPMVLVCAPDDELAAVKSVRLSDLKGRALVQFDHGLCIRKQIDRALQADGVEVSVAMEFDNIETIKRAVEIGAGVSLLPEPTVTREVESGTLVRVSLADDSLVRPLAIVHRRGRRLSGTAKRFIELLTSQSTDGAPDGSYTASSSSDKQLGDIAVKKPRSQKAPKSEELKPAQSIPKSSFQTTQQIDASAAEGTMVEGPPMDGTQVDST